jgi:hypothetical protein
MPGYQIRPQVSTHIFTMTVEYKTSREYTSDPARLASLTGGSERDENNDADNCLSHSINRASRLLRKC